MLDSAICDYWMQRPYVVILHSHALWGTIPALPFARLYRFITGTAMNSGAQNINNSLTLSQIFYLQFFQSKGGTDKNAKTLQPVSDKTQLPLKYAS